MTEERGLDRFALVMAVPLRGLQLPTGAIDVTAVADVNDTKRIKVSLNNVVVPEGSRRNPVASANQTVNFGQLWLTHV